MVLFFDRRHALRNVIRAARTRWATLHGQIEFSDVVLSTAPGTPRFDYDRTKTVGASYTFRADLVVKGEYHFTNGYWADAPLTDIGFAPAKVSYFLVSFSTSF